MSVAAVATRMAFATGLCLSVHGCENVQGGAVELSWKLRPASSSLEDKFVDCDSGREDTGPVAYIRLDWEVRGQQGFTRWECDDNHGTTGFDLPEGAALLRVTPECLEGEEAQAARPDSYIAPAAEQRGVIPGDTISLGAVEIIVVVTDCRAQSCICGVPFASGHTPGNRGGAAIASTTNLKQPAAAPSNARHQTRGESR
jgi:hypothetical protein